MRTFIFSLVTILTILATLLVAFLGISLIGLGFLGIGWMFSHIFPLSQYEATIVAFGACIVLIWTTTRIAEMLLTTDGEEDEEEEEEEHGPPPYKRIARDLKRKRAKR
jgi:uncharacterized membrane protein YqjE